MPLHLVVIGAGLAGLSAAIATKLENPDHVVTILESVKELGEVGAGLQLTPNSTRLFRRWGIYDSLVPYATVQRSLAVHRWDGTKLLAHEPRFQEQIHERYGAPFWGMHRVDLQRAMATRAEEIGVTLRLNSHVKSVDFDAPSVTVESDEVIKGDVILCADGLWSRTRSSFVGEDTPAMLTGDLAYRIVIDAKDLSGPDADELRAVVAAKSVNFWVGPGTHVVAYSVRAESTYNIVLLSPDTLPESVTKSEGDLEEMKSLFDGWDPLLRKFLDQVQSVTKWKLMWLDTLSEWANQKGTFIMAGDSCHPMLPYLAQGANSSLEDGAVLGYLLGQINQPEKQDILNKLSKVASLYQDLRKERDEMISKETFKQRKDFHLEDGEEQVARDNLMVSMLGEELEVDFPSRWTCPRVQRWLYGYDGYEEAEKAFRRSPF